MNRGFAKLPALKTKHRGLLTFAMSLLVFVTPLILAAGQDDRKCSVVSVESKAHVQGHDYVQHGVGTVFALTQGDSQLKIFVPNHVISGADQVSIRCDETEIPVKVAGTSNISDMAVLSVDPKSMRKLSPFFTADGETKQGVDSSPQMVLIANKKESSPLFFDFDLGVVAPSHPDQPILGTGEGYLIDDLGVRPGMSGSPVINSKSGEFLGVVTKTQIGESHSYGLTAASIRRSLAALLKGQDPAVKYNDRNRVRIDERLIPSSDGKRVFRHRILTVTDAFSGKVTHVFEDRCPSSIYAETSGWMPAGGWADGGGGSKSKREGQFPSFILGKSISSPTGILDSKWISVFRGDENCTKDGVEATVGSKNLGGASLIALRPIPEETLYGSNATPIDSVDRLYKLYELTGPNWLDKVRKYGVFEKPGNDSMAFLCSTGGFQDENLLQVCDVQVPQTNIQTPDGLIDLVQFNLLYNSTSGSTQSGHSGKDGAIKCNKDTGQIDFDYHFKEGFHFSLSITRSKIKVHRIQLGRCLINNAEFPKGAWEGRIETKDMAWDVKIPFGGQTTLLQLVPIRISPSCSKQEFELQSINFGRAQSEEKMLRTLQRVLQTRRVR